MPQSYLIDPAQKQDLDPTRRAWAKGKLAVGYDADLVLVALETDRPVRWQGLPRQWGGSPFESWHLTGWPGMTCVNGQIAHNGGQGNDQVRGKTLRFQS